MKNEILKEIFYCLSTALVIFLGLELLYPNIILAYLNINLVLISWVIVGIIILAGGNKINKKV